MYFMALNVLYSTYDTKLNTVQMYGVGKPYSLQKLINI